LAGERIRRQMTGKNVEQALPEVNEAAMVPSADVSRREFLGRLALAGAGAAGLSLLGGEAEAAPPPSEYILGTYALNQNYTQRTMTIESQSGFTFIGRFDDGTAVEGSVAGAVPGPVVLCFTRRTPEGSVQIFTGAAVTRPVGVNREALLTGVYYHNGTGPLPWVATGTLRL
jgi:hypothetical protein